MRRPAEMSSAPRGSTRAFWQANSVSTKNEQPIGAPLPGLPGQAVVGLLTPDANAVIAGYGTGQAYRWDLRPASLTRQACGIAGRTLTRAEWDGFLPGRDYEPARTN